MDSFQVLALPEDIQKKIQILDNGCWYWTGSKNSRNYSSYWHGKSGQFKTGHLWVYELLVEKPPRGLKADHLCHDFTTCNLGDECPHRRCVNPAHIEFKTDAENYQRSNRLYTQKSATHCINGHEYTIENTRIDDNGRRNCRTCSKLKAREYRGGLSTPATHCMRGHEFTPENTFVKTNGTRRCKTCRRKYG